MSVYTVTTGEYPQVQRPAGSAGRSSRWSAMTAYPPALTTACCGLVVLLVAGTVYLVATATDHLDDDVMGLLRGAMSFGAFTAALSVVVSVAAHSVREHQARSLAALAAEVHALRRDVRQLRDEEQLHGIDPAVLDAGRRLRGRLNGD